MMRRITILTDSQQIDVHGDVVWESKGFDFLII